MDAADIDAMFAAMPLVCRLVGVPSGAAVVGCRMMQTNPFKGRGETLAFVPVGISVRQAG
jgi:hypothetical protein